jgi:hypothetical protein
MFGRTTGRDNREIRPLTIKVDHAAKVVELTIDDQPIIMSLSNWTFAIANPEPADLSVQRRILDEANAGTPA